MELRRNRCNQRFIVDPVHFLLYRQIQYDGMGLITFHLPSCLLFDLGLILLDHPGFDLSLDTFCTRNQLSQEGLHLCKNPFL